MLSTRHSILGSSVFQRVLAASGLFVLISLAALWVLTWIITHNIISNQDDRIAEMLAYGEELFYGDSEQALIDQIAFDDGPIWSSDEIYWILEEEHQIFTFRNADGDAVAGYPDLWAATEVERFILPHPDIEEEVRARSVQLRGGGTITVGEFIPQRYYEAVNLAAFGTLAMIVIVLPLALITGFFLSRGVFNRIEGVSETAAAVARGEMTSRAPVTGRLDEFDRLSLGINQMLDRVDTLNSNIEAVSVGVAHDLKTPLANLGGRLELIRRDLQDSTAVSAHVEAAENHLSQVLRIFDAILRLGEVEAGGRRAAFVDVDLSQLVRDLGEAYAPVFEDADKTMSVDIASGVHLRGDPELLQQLLANLLENALEHSRDAAKVHLRLVRSDTISLHVADDGPGIAPPDRDRIFDRFFRADSSRTSPGNGLGLSLVRAIADLHGAQATLDPEAEGAHFSVIFQQGD
ncbi:MAG: HAMP domain-containing sensor histidine kinase [Pseudomonadota bacterium]